MHAIKLVEKRGCEFEGEWGGVYEWDGREEKTGRSCGYILITHTHEALAKKISNKQEQLQST